MTSYVLDSNFFIQAHRMHYPFDVFPSFWDKIQELAEKGIIVSIDKVKKELVHNKDDLTTWITQSLPMNFFHSSENVLSQYKKIVEWVASKADHYSPSALSEFLSSDEADAWLVAYTLGNIDDRILITHETSQPGRRNKVKIPEACNAFGVRFMDTVNMLRQVGVRF